MANHKKNAGFLLPTTDEYENFCITFVVPNEQNHKAAFFGALKKLSDWYNWEQDNTTAGKEAADIWRDILANPTYSMDSEGCGDLSCCDGLEFRSENGRLQYRVGSGGLWGDTNFLMEIRNENYYNSEITYQVAPEDPAEDRRACATAMALGQYLVDRFNDTLDVIDANVDTASAVDVVLAYYPPLYLLVDQILDVVDEIVEATTEASRVWLDTQQILEIKEIIFCHLYPSNEWSEEIWNDIKDDIAGRSFHPVRVVFVLFLNLFTQGGIGYKARLYSHGGGADAECLGFPCAVWEYLFDFAADGQQGWDLYSGTTFETGVGFHSFHSTNNAGGSFNAGEELGTTLIGFAGGYITSAVLYITVAPLSVYSAHNAQVDGVTNTNALEEGTLEIEFSIEDDVTNLYIYTIVNNNHPSAFQPTGGEQTVSAILLRGTGLNPFI